MQRASPYPPAWLFALLVLAAPLALYARTLTFGFTSLDDPAYVVNNPHVHAGLTAQGLAWAFTTTETSNWHPLTWISLMLDAQLGGAGPQVYHAVNLLLHSVNGLLLYLALRAMTGLAGRCAFVALLFAVHPLHVESVAWIAERKDVLSTLFWMLTILAYARHVRAPRAGSWALVIALYALGLMAKPMLVSLPFVLLLLDQWPLGRFAAEKARWRTLLLEKVPLFLLAAASSIVTFLVQQRTGSVGSVEKFQLVGRLANAAVAYATYLVQTFWPTGLAAFYPYPRSLPHWQVGASLVLLAAVTTMAIRWAGARPWLLTGWGWYVVTLVPVIGLVQVGLQARADRYTYIPLIGIFITVTWAASEILGQPRERWSTALPALGGAVVVALFVLAWLQLAHWRDGVALLERAVAVTKDNALAHNFLGMALEPRGRVEEAVSHYEEALRVDPDYAEAHSNLARALARERRFDDAAAHYEQAVRLEPLHVPDRVALAAVLLKQRRIDEAVVQLTEAARLEPRSSDVLARLAEALVKQGHADEAIERSGQALRSDPDHPVANAARGVALMSLGRNEEAAQAFSASLRRAPDNTGVLQNLGLVLARQGRREEALIQLERAVGVDPASVDARVNLGVVLAEQGRLDEAIAQFEEALRLSPTNEVARRNLEWVRKQRPPRHPDVLERD